MTTGGTFQFKAPSRQETPRRLVIIGNVDIEKLNASAIDFNGGGILNIDLGVYNAPVIQYPKKGEHWYVELVQQRWILRGKDKVASPAYLNANVSPGDQLWDSQGNITVTATGNFSLTDSHGSLVTIAPSSWSNVTINNTFLSQRGTTYPAAIQVILVNNNIVFIRGLVNIIGGLTTLTTCATVLSGFYPTNEAHFSVKSDQPNLAVLVTPNGSLQFDWSGTAPTWSFVNGSWCTL